MNDVQAQVAQMAADYQMAQRPSILEPHHDAVILLRAKEASYDAIADMLQDSGVTVSPHTVRRFCRRYSAEIKRRRQDMAIGKNTASPPSAPTSMPATTTETSSPSRPRPVRDLRGPV
ncbi:MAG: hypothetical protein HC904_01255 [Blastochloris sp.]|nr:hypothetical protein [Blastochloris sp.]